ncbi:hypothetical protein [Hydrogenophaga sp. OTU3427]|uniref:hypothetical protein n=1 Tax=Hydrogenophaga sp. OTU3427 TaxID=3043856 RepID=UPI00313E92E9
MNNAHSFALDVRGLARGLARVAGLCALGAAGLAQANDVNWSIGLNSPGVSVGVSNSRPVLVYPQPVYGAPVYGAPVYVQPQPVYQVRPMPSYGYVQPVVVHPYAPVTVWGPRGHGHKHKHRHGHDRWDRDDDGRRWR